MSDLPDTDQSNSVLSEWHIDCPNCRADGAIAYRRDVRNYECPHCRSRFTAEDLIRHTKRLKQQAKRKRQGLLLAGLLGLVLLILLPLLTVRVELNEAENAIDLTAPGLQITLQGNPTSGPELQFYLIGEYLGRWQLNPPAIEVPTTTPTPSDETDPDRVDPDEADPTPPPIPRPATLDSA